MESRRRRDDDSHTTRGRSSRVTRRRHARVWRLEKTNSVSAFGDDAVSRFRLVVGPRATVRVGARSTRRRIPAVYGVNTSATAVDDSNRYRHDSAGAFQYALIRRVCVGITQKERIIIRKKKNIRNTLTTEICMKINF